MYNAQNGVLNDFSAFHIGLIASIVTCLLMTGIVVVKQENLELRYLSIMNIVSKEC